MTARAEGQKHIRGGECVRHPERSVSSLEERFPKWNPRYVAYALSQGATDIKAFRDAQTSNAGFIAWIGQQREAWRASHHVRSPYLTRDEERAFDRWLQRQVEEVPSRD